MTYDVEFTYETPMMTKSKTFKGITLEMYKRLREKYTAKYGNDLLSIDTFIHGTELRVDSMSWYYEEDEEYRNPIAFYERYGW